MISIRKKPSHCSFTQNPIKFELGTDQYYPTPLVYPVFEIIFSAQPARGSFIYFEFINPETQQLEKIKLTAKRRDLVNEGDFLSNDNPFPTLIDFVTHALTEARKIKLLNAFYTIEQEGTLLRIKAKRAIEQLVFQGVHFYSESSTFTILYSNDYYQPQPREGYQMHASIFLETQYGSGSFQFLTACEIVVDENLRAYIDIHKILQGGIEASWQEYPLPDLRYSHYFADNLRRYYVEFSEEWYNSGTLPTTKSDTLFAHWGGIDLQTSLLRDPIDILKVSQRFMTEIPSGKLVDRNQTDWLSWMNLTYARRIRVDIVIGVSTIPGVSPQDITEKTFVLFDIQMDLFQTLVFQTGYLFRDVEQLAVNYHVHNWKFVIKDFDSKQPLSEFYQYDLADSNCTKHSILYFNNYGMPETFYTIGEWTEALRTSKSLAERGDAYNLSKLRPEVFAFNREATHTYKLRSQWFTQKVARAIGTLLHSQASYLWDNDQLVPTMLQSAETDYLDTQEIMLQIPMEMFRATTTQEVSDHPDTPSLEYEWNGGNQYTFYINRNDYTITSVGDLTLKTGFTTITTSVWDSGTEKFTPVTLAARKIVTASCTITTAQHGTITLTKIFEFKRNEVVMYTTLDGGGTVNLVVYRNDPSPVNMAVEHDNGNNEVTYTLGAATNIPFSYTIPGTKWLSIFKDDFTDISGLSANGLPIVEFDFNRFTGLENLTFDNCTFWPVLLLNRLTQLEDLELSNMPLIEVIELGFCPSLNSITLDTIGLTAEGLDLLIDRLYAFRNFYYNTWTLTITASGLTPSTDTAAKIAELTAAPYNHTISIA